MDEVNNLIDDLQDLKGDLLELIDTHPALAPLREGYGTDVGDAFFQTEEGQEFIQTAIVMAWQTIMNSIKSTREELDSIDDI